MNHESGAIEGKRENTAVCDPVASPSIQNPSIDASSGPPSPSIATSSSIPIDQQYMKLHAAAEDGTAAALNEPSKATVGSMIGEGMASGIDEAHERPAKRAQLLPDVVASPPYRNKVSITHISNSSLKKTKHIVPMKALTRIMS